MLMNQGLFQKDMYFECFCYNVYIYAMKSVSGKQDLEDRCTQSMFNTNVNFNRFAVLPVGFDQIPNNNCPPHSN